MIFANERLIPEHHLHFVRTSGTTFGQHYGVIEPSGGGRK
jgi:hypothetical protein